jgi:putative ABC transport system permease protein
LKTEQELFLERNALSPLNKKLLRDLATHWAQVIAIIAVVALGIIMFSGPLLAQRDLRGSIDDIYRRTNYEDFAAEVQSAPASSVSGVSGLPNVKVAEGRVSRDLLASVKGTRLTLRVISVPDRGRPAVDGLLIESGRYPAVMGPGLCLAEHHLSDELGLRPGDSIELLPGGGTVKLRVAAAVVSPEYLRLVRSRSEYVTDPAQFGVVFMGYSETARLFGFEGRVNNIVATVRDQDRLRATMKGAEVILRPYGLTGLTRGSDEPGAVTLELEINDIGKLALFFAVLLLAVASLALYITMTQIVFSQQREIGLTRAVGYRRRTLMTHYLGYGLVLGISGGILGIICGYLLSGLFIHIYADIFDLPLIRTTFSAAIAAAGVGAALVFSIAGALVPARHAVRMRPAEAMRTDAGISLGVTSHRRKPRAARSLGVPAWVLVSLRNLVRNRRRTVLTCLGVVATVCLMVTATGGRDTLDFAVEKYLHGVLKWDVAAGWSNPVGPPVLLAVRSIPGVVAAEPMIDAPARISALGRSADVQVQAYEADTKLHGDYPTRGSRSRPGPGEIVLNRGLTERLPVKIGDSVTVSSTVGSLPFTVVGFVSEPFGGVCYVNLAYIQGLLAVVTGAPDQFNAVVIQAGPGRTDQVSSALRRLPGVTQVITKSSILKVFEELVGAIKMLFYIFYVMAFAMGFAVLFSMVTVNLFERRREIATMRTLGAGKRRVFSFLTIETVTVVLVALVPGILLGRLLEWVVIEKLVSSDRLVPDAVISGMTILVIIMASLAVMVLSELPSIRKLWHLDLATVTKERAD